MGRSSGSAFAENPLEGEQLFLDAVFGKKPAERQTSRKPPVAVRPPERSKPEHYKIVSISLYKEDIDRLDAMVKELKARGFYKANKSQLIRYALAQLDLDGIAPDPHR